MSEKVDAAVRWIKYLVLILTALAACLSGLVDHVIRSI